jgi:hypothetical protein
MRKFLVATGVGLAVILGTALPASATTPQSTQNCVNTVDNQFLIGVVAGGGPKAGSPAPTNCDHFYQEIGVIGSGK